MPVTYHRVQIWNNLIVIPEKLTERVIDIAHEGHQGITKTKALIRSKVWFLKLDQIVGVKLGNCYTCMANSIKSDFRPLKMYEMPDGPWQVMSIDFYGPTPLNTTLDQSEICDELNNFFH